MRVEGIEYASLPMPSLAFMFQTAYEYPRLPSGRGSKPRESKALARLSSYFFSLPRKTTFCDKKQATQTFASPYTTPSYRPRPDVPLLSEITHFASTSSTTHHPSHTMAQSAAPNNPFIKQLVHNGITLSPLLLSHTTPLTPNLTQTAKSATKP